MELSLTHLLSLLIDTSFTNCVVFSTRVQHKAASQSQQGVTVAQWVGFLSGAVKPSVYPLSQIWTGTLIISQQHSELHTSCEMKCHATRSFSSSIRGRGRVDWVDWCIRCWKNRTSSDKSYLAWRGRITGDKYCFYYTHIFNSCCRKLNDNTGLKACANYTVRHATFSSDVQPQARMSWNIILYIIQFQFCSDHW